MKVRISNICAVDYHCHGDSSNIFLYWANCDIYLDKILVINTIAHVFKVPVGLNDKVNQLLAHGRCFSPGTPASSALI